MTDIVSPRVQGRHRRVESIITLKNGEEAFSSNSLATTWVTNEERPKVIQAIFAKVFPEYKFESILQALPKSEDFLSLVVKTQPVTAVGKFACFKEYEAKRASEINDLLKYRLNNYREDYYSIKAGLAGEEALKRSLDLHPGLTTLYGLRFEGTYNGEKRSCEIDAIAITEGGIFAMESKNYGQNASFRIEIEADGTWYKITRNANTGKEYRNMMENPVAQNDWHVAVLEKQLIEILNRKIPVHNIVVLTNDDIVVKSYGSANTKIARVGTVYNQISQYTTQVLTAEEVEKLKNELASRSLQPQKFPLWDYSDELVGLINSRKEINRAIVDAYEKIEKCYREHPLEGLPE